jgi:hypothetical protein
MVIRMLDQPTRELQAPALERDRGIVLIGAGSHAIHFLEPVPQGS